MYCTECGTKIVDGAKFCIECGAPVKTILAEAAKAYEEKMAEAASVSDSKAAEVFDAAESKAAEAFDAAESKAAEAFDDAESKTADARHRQTFHLRRDYDLCCLLGAFFDLSVILEQGKCQITGGELRGRGGHLCNRCEIAINRKSSRLRQCRRQQHAPSKTCGGGFT